MSIFKKQHRKQRIFLFTIFGLIFIIFGILAFSGSFSTLSYISAPAAVTKVLRYPNLLVQRYTSVNNTKKNGRFVPNIPDKITLLFGAKRRYDKEEELRISVGEYKTEQITLAPAGNAKIAYYFVFEKPTEDTAKIPLPLTLSGVNVGLFTVSADGQKWGIVAPSCVSLLEQGPITGFDLNASLDKMMLDESVPDLRTYNYPLAGVIPCGGGIVHTGRGPENPPVVKDAEEEVLDWYRRFSELLTKCNEKNCIELNEEFKNITYLFSLKQGKAGAFVPPDYYKGVYTSPSGEVIFQDFISGSTATSEYIYLKLPDLEKFESDVVAFVSTFLKEIVMGTNTRVNIKVLEPPLKKKKIVRKDKCYACEVEETTDKEEEKLYKLMALSPFVFDISNQDFSDDIRQSLAAGELSFDVKNFGLFQRELSGDENAIMYDKVPEGSYITVGVDWSCKGGASAFSELMSLLNSCKSQNVRCSINLIGASSLANAYTLLKNGKMCFKGTYSISLGVPVLSAITLDLPNVTVAKGMYYNLIDTYYSGTIIDPLSAEILARYNYIELFYILDKLKYDLSYDELRKLMPNLVADAAKYYKEPATTLTRSKLREFADKKAEQLEKARQYISPVIFTSAVKFKLYPRVEKGHVLTKLFRPLGPYKLRVYMFVGANLKQLFSAASQSEIPTSPECTQTYVDIMLKSLADRYSFAPGHIQLVLTREASNKYLAMFEFIGDSRLKDIEYPSDIETLEKCFPSMVPFFKNVVGF